MLQTETTTNSTNNGIANIDKQADIAKRLEELNQWQEEQKQQLLVRQTLQRQMLGLEQRTMYQMLGLQSDSEMSVVEEERQKCSQVESSLAKGAEHLEEYEEYSTEESLETSQMEEEERRDECESYMTLTSGYDAEGVCLELRQTKPKKPFLKRGEGLKQRFKIDPEELRLNNLPKYKYANAHPRLRLKPFNKCNSSRDLNPKPIEQKKIITKKPTVNFATLDAQEQRFHNLLIISQNTCNSTPDTKSSFVANKLSSAVTDSALPNGEKPKLMGEKCNLTLNTHEIQSKDGSKMQPAGTHVPAWSKILDPLEIQPLQVPRNCIQTLPETEESIFELLEQKAKEGSFDMDSTCLKEFITRRISEKLNETDDNIPVQEQLKNKRLEPVVSDKLSQEPSYCSSDETEEEESQATDVSTEYNDTTDKSIETANSSYPQKIPQVRVRFSDSNETHEYEEESESTLQDTNRLSAGSNQQEGQGDTSNNELFTQFKQALFAALQIKTDQHLGNDSTVVSVSDTTITPTNSFSVPNNCENGSAIYTPACKELKDKTDMIKTRLAELEKEIQNFKDNTIILMKAKQEHELHKSLNAQEHLEAMEKLKDEKIQMEIYLHDERVKLEEERRQFEQNIKMRTQGVIAKERKECERLRDQVSQLELQLKSKETNHTTSQARLRSQIRNMEKEQSKLHEQIENLTRENKRLENEVIKISREQNNKILLEINRNIAKLAPKQIRHSSIHMPDEGPPTLGASKTVSKCIVAAANSNKNSGKAHKTTSTRFPNVKAVTNKTIQTQKCEEPETSPETSFVQEKQQQKHNDEGDDEDILDDFVMTHEKINNIPTTAATNAIKNSAHRPMPRDQDQIPAPPPTSPRESGEYGNKMKREIVNADGSKDIWYPNGNLKKISADGMIIRMLYYNKDIKETNINEGTVKYYYAETNTWHTTYLDGLEILEFPNGQIEHRHKNGIVEIHYPNNSIKIMDAKDEHKQEEWRFPDGTHLVQMRNGDKILSLPNGQKEIHNKLHKRREYPDGTVKIVYPDGSTETRYSNGRVRLKDKEGKLVMDTDMGK